jgi:RHH-type proline utilization regulon transcriptional repressor/proline dehydrogenase/delta 1-pyrroline-5-carboxylate dehydrogenase
MQADAEAPVAQNDGISIKLSALHPRYEDAQHARVMAELVPRVWDLCERAARANINLTIDAEEMDRLELSLDVFEALARQGGAALPAVARLWAGHAGLPDAGALELIDHVAALARKYHLRLMCRLVKGAYWDAEIKRAQELGLPHYPVFTHKHHTDVSYLACARRPAGCTRRHLPPVCHPQRGHHCRHFADGVQAHIGAPVPTV